MNRNHSIRHILTRFRSIPISNDFYFLKIKATPCSITLFSLINLFNVSFRYFRFINHRGSKIRQLRTYQIFFLLKQSLKFLENSFPYFVFTRVIKTYEWILEEVSAFRID